MRYPRQSTVVLVAAWIALMVVYIAIRPEPKEAPKMVPVTPPGTTQQYYLPENEVTTPPPVTTTPEPTTTTTTPTTTAGSGTSPSPSGTSETPETTTPTTGPTLPQVPGLPFVVPNPNG